VDDFIIKKGIKNLKNSQIDQTPQQNFVTEEVLANAN
jgi:hypothetical protein